MLEALLFYAQQWAANRVLIAGFQCTDVENVYTLQEYFLAQVGIYV
jgi:hypothetical protein